MMSAISSAFSGLSAFTKQIGVTANNTANVMTDGFKKSRAVLEETQPQGVQARVETIDSPGPLAVEPTQSGLRLVEQSNVDIAEEMVNLMLGQRAYEANLKTIQAEDKRIGSFLDIME